MICPGCGRKESAEVVMTVTPVEAAELSAREFRRLGTVRCPDCGYWYFCPPRVSPDPDPEYLGR
jgi:hypothetical protein